MKMEGEGTSFYPTSSATIRTKAAAMCIDATHLRTYSSANHPPVPMRILLIVLLIVLISSASAYAQLRTDLPGDPAPVVLTDSQRPLTLSGLFNTQTLRIGHSYEFSYTGYAGGSLGLGIYTTSLQWQPSSRLAARVDVGVAHSPFGSADVQQALGFDQNTPARVFLRNAEIAYRPTENSVLRLQIQQNPMGAYGRSPYGSYASPYGYGGYGYAPGSYGTSLQARYGSDSEALFWRGY